MNGQAFLVRENLGHFLKTAWARYDIREGYFWIDQICIDQASKAEQNHQVKMMGDVYQKADQVLLWLGLNSLEAFQQLETAFGHCISELRDNMIFWAQDLCSRRYWRRLWIIQEVMLARSIFVMSGSMALPWREFVEYLHRHPSLSMGVQAGLINKPTDWFVPEFAASVINERQSYEGGDGRRNLRLVLERFMSGECENPRDRVYGLAWSCRGSREHYRRLRKAFGRSVLRSAQRCCTKELADFRSVGGLFRFLPPTTPGLGFDKRREQQRNGKICESDV